MNTNTKTALGSTREQDYSKWYQEVIKAADLAENAVVRGCMVIKPWGYAIWENIQQYLDKRIKETGHENFYFPMFIPLSLMQKEAKHVEDFAKECAVVTHHRLVLNDKGQLIPAGELEEPLVVRPTSEVIIGEAFSRWINSYRDLPLLGNQWANIVRWEMRPRVFLRTSEFLWQEGHTAHATREEAIAEARQMLEVYREVAEELLAMPVICGEKTEKEKFPGAENTYCIEAMMQDGRALQAGTSHFLGQNFAQAFNIKFLSSEGTEQYVWTTSWGVTTRLIGGIIMTHSDDDGLILPPAIAPIHIVIVPLIHNSEDKIQIIEYCNKLQYELQNQPFYNGKVKVKIDLKDARPGEKIWSWIKKGVPIRVEIGTKELESDAVFIGRRIDHAKDKRSLDRKQFIHEIESMLHDIQHAMFKKAQGFLENNTITAHSQEQFFDLCSRSSPNLGFIQAFWSGDSNTEAKLKEEFAITARCIPIQPDKQFGQCIFTGQDNAPLTVFAKSY